MLNLYINGNYQMLVNTLLFLKFDVYVMYFNDTTTEDFYNNYSNQLFNNQIDLNIMKYYYNPIMISGAVPSMSSKTERVINITNQKKYNEIFIGSYNDIYNFQIPTNTGHVYIILIKQFDNVNYIVPVTISAGSDLLIANNYNLDLRYLFQVLDNKKEIKDTLSTFRKIIL